MIDLDAQPIDIPCPSCGKKFKEKIGRVKRQKTLTCPRCRHVITIDATQLRQAVDAAQKDADALRRELDKLGK